MGRTPVAGARTDVASNCASHLGAAGFFVFWIDAGVTEFWVGEGDDLAAVAGVGQNFLIAGHAGVKYHLPHGGAGGPERPTMINSSIDQNEKGRLSSREGHRTIKSLLAPMRYYATSR